MSTNQTSNALDKYQQVAARTAKVNDPYESQINEYVYGLIGELGEVVDLIKKCLKHGHDLDKEELKKELGDLLWYLSNMARVNDLKLSDIAICNIEKLKKRFPDGFDSERSKNRAE